MNALLLLAALASFIIDAPLHARDGHDDHASPDGKFHVSFK
jgi:hypothetical protein